MYKIQESQIIFVLVFYFSLYGRSAIQFLIHFWMNDPIKLFKEDFVPAHGLFLSNMNTQLAPCGCDAADLASLLRGAV